MSKLSNIEKRTRSEKLKAREPSFKRRLRSTSKTKWEQHASRQPGASREYLMAHYGERAFNPNGTINMSVLNQAIAKAKSEGDTLNEKRLVLAKTYKLTSEGKYRKRVKV